VNSKGLDVDLAQVLLSPSFLGVALLCANDYTVAQANMRMAQMLGYTDLFSIMHHKLSLFIHRKDEASLVGLLKTSMASADTPNRRLLNVRTKASDAFRMMEIVVDKVRREVIVFMHYMPDLSVATHPLMNSMIMQTQNHLMGQIAQLQAGAMVQAKTPTPKPQTPKSKKRAKPKASPVKVEPEAPSQGVEGLQLPPLATSSPLGSPIKIPIITQQLISPPGPRTLAELLPAAPTQTLPGLNIIKGLMSEGPQALGASVHQHRPSLPVPAALNPTLPQPHQINVKLEPISASLVEDPRNQGLQMAAGLRGAEILARAKLCTGGCNSPECSSPTDPSHPLGLLLAAIQEQAQAKPAANGAKIKGLSG